MLSTSPGAPIRLCYRLSVPGRVQTASVSASLSRGGEPLDEATAKRLLPRLHALDLAIARELLSGTIFGHFTDAQLARVLPLLAQRDTLLGERALVIDEPGLVPRLQVDTTSNANLRLTLWLSGRRGERVELRAGRLVVGTQAFFIQGESVTTVHSSAPWELATWTRAEMLEMGVDVGPTRRDELVRTLAKAGVPATDLQCLAVRRMPPSRWLAQVASQGGAEGLEAHLTLYADYAGTLIAIVGRDPHLLHVVPAEHSELGLIERDVGAEREARRLVAEAGFRFDTGLGHFVARGETGLRALDPDGGSLPNDWAIERSGSQPVFRRGLDLRARVRLIEERGMLELDVGLTADDSDEAIVRELINMKDLLAWLDTGGRYVELADGSFAAPSPHLRRGLRILQDLGAETARALVSPLCIGLLKALGDDTALAAADTATRAWLDEVSGSSHPEHVPAPANLAEVLRDYQQRGLDWLGMLHRHRLTGILADDMGLGKTLQTLALLDVVRTKEGPKPSLVVAPTSVLSVWRDEAIRFAPQLRVVLWQGTPEERRDINPGAYDLVVTSYGILRRDAALLAAIDFRYVILDEAQSAKNASTQNARAVRQLKSERRLALTGTPLENRPEELWATFDFLAPGFLGSLRNFRKRYARPIERGETEPLRLLRARITPLVLRRLKEEVARELPKKLESVVRCEMNVAQRALYDHIAGDLKDSIKERIESVGIERARMAILAALTRLRQVCCDPSLLPTPPGVKAPDSAKLALFEELMREALASNRRIVVFSQFVEMQKRIITVIKKLGVDPVWLHGGTRHRDRVVASFQDPSGPPVMVVSLKAGGTGVTLTRADTVMHYDPWWNPAVERQASDRTHRLGQRQQVTVYKLVCARSIEERVLEMAERKDALATQLLSTEGRGPKRITVEEVLALIG